MGLLGRSIFGEIVAGAGIGTLLFTFVIFLERVSRLFEQLVRGAAPAKTVGYLFLMVLPFTLAFTIPIGVLVGVLIGLSRMSSDGEIIAMRAAGVSSRRVLTPVLLFAFLGTLVAGACSLWLNPLAVRETYRVLNVIAADQMAVEVQRGVFAEQFPNKTIYVSDVIAGPVIRWRNVFIADMTPAAERKRSTQENGDAPGITIASEALVVPDSEHNRLQLRLINGSKHDVGKELNQYFNSYFPSVDQLLEAKAPEEQRAKAYTEMDTTPLMREARSSREADIELQRRFSLPPACLLLALVAVPLGVSSRKAGKSSAFVLTVFLSFLYFMAQVSLIGLAKQGRMAPVVAAWLPNAAFLVVGLIGTIRLESPGDADWLGRLRDWFAASFGNLSIRVRVRNAPRTRQRASFRAMPQIVDTYILGTFFFYFGIMLASLVLMQQVFTFFELLSDILKNNIPLTKVGTYHLFLTPKLIYDSTPMSVMVGILITFGVLSKQNEVTAFKACGISLYRLALPVLLASIVISGALFAFDFYVVPDANLVQDGIRNEIKGRAVRTFLRPDRQWIYGKGARIFHYKYFDPTEKVMAGVHVYELDPKTFRLRRHISAERAQWQPGIATWIFQNGWSRDIDSLRVRDYKTWQATTFPEISEQPEHFLPEEKQYKQLNFRQLAAYMADLSQSGFDTVRLRVQYHRKFSVPLFSFILAIIAVPFAFLMGNRGAMASVGASFIIAIAYLALGQLFEQVGNLNQLPATLAAWSPNAIFTLAGLYLMTRMRS